MSQARAIFFLVFLAVFSSTACQADPSVAIATKSGREVVFQVEIADTPVKREMGLQYPNDRGMIFLFPAESLQTFWMKNTPIPLDMVFISREHKIVGIVEQAVPFSLDSRSVRVPSQFVLEINGGLAKKLGIETGELVRFDNFRVGPVAE